MTAPPTHRRRIYQTVALVASALGLFVACGMGARPSMPATPAPPLPPPAMLSLSITRLAFDPTPVGTPSAAQQVIVTNNNSITLHFTAIQPAFTRADEFVVDSASCGAALDPGKSCTVTVVFRPAAVGRAYGRLTFYIQDHQDVALPFNAIATPAPPPAKTP